MSLRCSAAQRRPCLFVEHLEARLVLSAVQPSAAEQLMLEELNDARANPAAYGAAVGLDLANVAPSQPLAFNPALLQAAEQHSQDMDVRAYFAHVTPDGADPGMRLTQDGFFWNSWGESIAGGSAFPQPANALSALIIDTGVMDLGHRRQLLAIDPMYQGQNQVGVGIMQNSAGPLVNYYTIDTASSPAAGPFLTGVVFNDLNGTGKYALGEGLGGVSIAVNGVPTVATWNAGGYSIALAPGSYAVTASGGGLPAPITSTVTVGAGNVRLNFAVANDTYIRKFYQTILGRAGSSAEVASWLPALQTQGPGFVAAAFEHSTEARTRLVMSWYVTYLGRQAQHGEEQPAVAALVRGETEEAALIGMLASPEFYARAVSLSRTGTADQRYVAALYSLLLHRSVTVGEADLWTPAMANAGTAVVAAGFVYSTEFRLDDVGACYATLLHRQTATSAAELAFWAASTLDLTSIRVGIEASPEFFLNG
jgi:uncharacterized protein YkwD